MRPATRAIRMIRMAVCMLEVRGIIRYSDTVFKCNCPIARLDLRRREVGLMASLARVRLSGGAREVRA
jgi:hypothetical protein